MSTRSDPDSIYRRATSAPATPAGGTHSEFHTPAGWSRTNPGASAGESVWQSERERYYEDGEFSHATEWGEPNNLHPNHPGPLE